MLQTQNHRILEKTPKNPHAYRDRAIPIIPENLTSSANILSWKEVSVNFGSSQY
jgi:hypothetical protein